MDGLFLRVNKNKASNCILSFGIFVMVLIIFSFNSACVNPSNFCNRDFNILNNFLCNL